MKTIIVTGSAATGKTTIAKKLAKEKNYKYIDPNQLIKKHKLYESYNRKLKTYEVDTKKLNKFLTNLIKTSKDNLIIDSHLSHYLPKKYVNLCIITKCNLKELKKRLEKRKYNKKKIRENLDAEILDTCLIEAKHHKIKIIDTSKPF
ncbi:MAG: adenylate kinase family protein [Nanoarchaeota archaeon]|nr:adenylate kinase family protein [Nanoarchaeota archaeon]